MWKSDRTEAYLFVLWANRKKKKVEGEKRDVFQVSKPLNSVPACCAPGPVERWWRGHVLQLPVC